MANPPVQIHYVNLYVSNLERSLEFFRDTLGLSVQYSDTQFGYASIDVGAIRMGLAQVDTGDTQQRALVGRQSGIGFATSDLGRTHAELSSAGVVFTLPPAKQPWGATMAMFEDPDRNVFYLDQFDPLD